MLRTALCASCALPQDVHELIYDLYVRQNLKPSQVLGMVKESLAGQGGARLPTPAAFYNHLKKHLDPERMALIRAARAADRVDTKGGLKGIALSYLVDQLNREKANRETLQSIINRLETALKDGFYTYDDLAKMSRAVGYLVKVRSDDRGITELVESKVMEDLVAGIIMMAGREMAGGMRDVKAEMEPRLGPADREEVYAILDRGFERIMKGLEGVYTEAVSEIGAIVKKGPGKGGNGGGE